MFSAKEQTVNKCNSVEDETIFYEIVQWKKQ